MMTSLATMKVIIYSQSWKNYAYKGMVISSGKRRLDGMMLFLLEGSNYDTEELK